MYEDEDESDECVWYSKEHESGFGDEHEKREEGERGKR